MKKIPQYKELYEDDPEPDGGDLPEPPGRDDF